MRKYRISKTANHDYFNKINSEKKAYLLGFILADGSIEEGYGCNAVAIRNSIDDIEAGLLFQSEIFPGNKIGFRDNSGKKRTFSIKGSSKEIIKDLKRFNIKPRKTYDTDFVFRFDLMPKKYYKDFIRGFFDGDGHVSFSKENKQFTMGFYATSKPFLEQLGIIIEKQFEVKYLIDTKKSKNMNVYCLRFNSGQKRKDFIQKLYHWLYNDSNCFLKRKHDKFELYLNTVLI
jgi:intein-encoded DNA endonuclease-like protein